MRTSLLSLILLTGCQASASSEIRSAPRAKAPADFWDHWGDGRAELNGYTLTQPRYGETHPGQAILVFVTETFTHRQRVKSDGGHADTYPVLKLNEIRDFQTGIYDYNLMTSAFVPLAGQLPLGVPTRVSFSMQEWCGTTHADLRADHSLGDDPEQFTLTGSSYFDGESHTDRRLDIPEGGITADALPIFVRGLAGDWLPPGQSIQRPYLPRLSDSRMRHRPLQWTTATFTRSEETAALTVPAGTFAVFTVTVDARGHGTSTWSVEAAPPHRLIAWNSDLGEQAELTGSFRDPYWQHSRKSDISRFDKLGLPRPAYAR